jgi:hypothetical protein
MNNKILLMMAVILLPSCSVPTCQPVVEQPKPPGYAAAYPDGVYISLEELERLKANHDLCRLGPEQ